MISFNWMDSGFPHTLRIKFQVTVKGSFNRFAAYIQTIEAANGIPVTGDIV